jgi:radical SAM/Cys-rich protein
MTVHLPLAPAAETQRFRERARHALGGELRARGVEVLQVNVGKVCNQACKHCHVDAGPARTESMSEATAALVLALVARHRFPVLDITGGAPELNPSFRALVEGGVASGSRVFVRHNLTVTFEPGQDDLPDFFAARGVELFSSLPHYTAEGTDRQRGGGVFAESIASLQRLNAVGYGQGDPRLPLTLVHNPVGAFLPGDPGDLEADFRRELAERHGVRFDRLVSIANMPIRRYREWLERTGQHARYQRTLEDAFNPATVSSLMCRTTVSVSWDGRLYDCDFNQMVDLAVLDADPTLAAFDLDALAERRIATAAHCFGCTAGSGSSCGGALT